MATMGRPSLFGQKDSRYRYQGVMTTDGGKMFEKAREELARWQGIHVRKVSDADVFERLCRGEDATCEYISEREARLKKIASANKTPKKKTRK